MRSAERSVDLGRWIVGAGRHASLTVASLIGAILLSLGGAAGSTFATDETGSLYDVGGYRLYLQCEGAGGPTVVMDAGLGGDHGEWSQVEPRVSTFSRVCSWDRAGRGRSDRRTGTGPVAVDRIVTDLHTLLAQAHADAPYVLVGHSTGGLDMREYQLRFPGQVAGLVMVDSTPEQEELRGSPIDSANGEAIDFGATRALQHQQLGQLPLVVIERGKSTDSLWQAEQASLSTRSANSTLIVASDSEHGIQMRQPGLVAAGIDLNVEAVRSHEPVQACPGAITIQGGACLAPGTSVPETGLNVSVAILLASLIGVLAIGIGLGAVGFWFARSLRDGAHSHERHT